MQNKNNKQTRLHFTKAFKRSALLEFSNGTKLDEILPPKGGDKKYASKLLYKWRNEYYENRNLIALIYENIDKNYAKKELETIGEDNCIDCIYQDIVVNKNSKFYT